MAANMPAGPAAAHPRIPIHDMEGVPHVLGGLVEASVGRKDLLFAKEVQGDLPDGYKTLKVLRHKYFAYPPPNMFEHNREFDRELEEARPTFHGFETDVIDRQVDYYGGGSEYFARLMEEHQAEFDPVYESFTSLKAQLTSLNYDRERLITSQFAEKPVMTQQARRKRLAEIAAAEEPLLEDIRHVRPELTEILFRGRVKIAHALKQDLRAPNVIDEKRFRAEQRTQLEEREREIGVAGAMIGLRGTPKQQSLENYTTIMRCVQIHVDEVLADFDEPEKLHRVGKPTKLGAPRPPRESYRNTVITTIPPWFTILDAKGTVKLYGATPLDRFRELTQSMGNSYAAAREERRNDESRPNKKLWPKQFHEPHGAWPKANQRERGGWWACRSGPDASRAERDCQLCHAEEPEPEPSGGRRAASVHQHITDEIEKAMAEANKRDRLMLKYQLQQEREDVDRYWQRREFNRSGGGANIREVMFRRGVNDLNYRPSAGRSQSWQQGSAAQSQGLGGMADGGVDKPRQMERAQTWPQPGHQPGSREALRGKQVEDINSPLKAVSQPPGDKLVEFPRFELLCGQTVENDQGLQTGSQPPQGLSGEHINKTNTQAEPSQPLQRPAGSPVHPLLSARQTNGNTPPRATGQSPPSQLLLGRSPPLRPQLSDVHVHGSTSPPALSTQGLGRSPPLRPQLSNIHVHGSTSPPVPSPRSLSRSPSLQPQLSDIHVHGSTSPRALFTQGLGRSPPLKPQLSNIHVHGSTSPPSQLPQRPPGSRTHPLLSGMNAPNKTTSPQVDRPSHPPQPPVRSRTHPLLSEMYTPNKITALPTIRMPHLLQHAAHPTVSQHAQGQAHPLFSNQTPTTVTTANNKQTPPPPPPPQPQPHQLHRHNSSQVHDVLHGRNETVLNPAEGPAQLRSALVRPGSGRRGVGGKRVSWHH